jgi:thioredoxin-like negative regulator of GroEL
VHDVVKKVTVENYASLLEQSRQTPILVMVTMADCPYCKRGMNALKRFVMAWMDGRAGSIVDTEKPDLATQYKLDTLPGYLLFWGGRVIRKETGLLEGAALAKFVSG